MGIKWNRKRAAEHIEQLMAQVDDPEIIDYTREKTLEHIRPAQAYRVQGVHVYLDILNIGEMLGVTAFEGEVCHCRTLRFLDLHYRALDRIVDAVGARRVDFHNQRLHAIVTRPYDTQDDAEYDRVSVAVAMADLVLQVLGQIGDDDAYIPPASLRVGIDTGEALAVNNGRNGGREPLFLGRPANIAAKLSGADTTSGIFLSPEARAAIGLPAVDAPHAVSLDNDQIAECVAAAGLGVNATQFVRSWRNDSDRRFLGDICFSAHTPPLHTLDIGSLTLSNSRRQDAVSVYADIDGFTAYVARHIESSPADVIKAFHVLRGELDRVLGGDFEGRRIRFIGDCVHGLLCEGTASETDAEATIDAATLCAGALHSSFQLCLEKLQADGVDTAGLDLAIGFEYGPMTVTRLGMKGRRVRCSVSRGVLASEAGQRGCGAGETAIGPLAYRLASPAASALFGTSRTAAGLDYDKARAALAGPPAAVVKGGGLLRAATRATPLAAGLSFPAHAVGPSKPAGFA